MLHTMSYDSPVGELLLAEKDGALVGLWIKGQKYFLDPWKGELAEPSESMLLKQAASWLSRYFNGEKPPLQELKIAPAGSAFRKEVWRILCGIPYGEVATYGEISKKISANRKFGNTSARAVGGAVGHNPISIIIPCHRVVGAGGSLTGYAVGIDKKMKLLAHERADMEKLPIPKTGIGGNLQTLF